MFPVARTHCILTTKFVRIFFFFFNDMCIYKPFLKVQKNILQNDFSA